MLDSAVYSDKVSPMAKKLRKPRRNYMFEHQKLKMFCEISRDVLIAMEEQAATHTPDGLHFPSDFNRGQIAALQAVLGRLDNGK